MLQGIYTAASGMLANDAIGEVIANNLANINTPGFRQDFATFHMAGEQPNSLGDSTLTPRLELTAYVDFEEGALRETHNPLDIALGGKGDTFFAIDAPQGLRFTRTGNFKLSFDNTIVTQDGLPALGLSGPIQADGSKIEITANGTVIVDGERVDQLQIVRFDRTDGRLPLLKDGHTLFRAQHDQAIPKIVREPEVHQGFLEGSNVNIIRQMAQMIHNTRGFEAYQRAILVSDSSLNMLIQRVGGGN